MSERYKVKNPEGVYFITTTVVDWIDLFIRPVYKHIIIDSLKHCQENKGLVIHAFVLMGSHLHGIFSTSGEIPLQEIFRDFKKHTSKELVKAINEYPESRREWMLERFNMAAERIKRGANYKVWQDGFHPIELLTAEMVKQRLDYTHNNPVEEEIVINPEDYKYSSASAYADGDCVLEFDKVL